MRDNEKEDRGDFSDGFWDQIYELRSGKQIKVEPEMKEKKWWGTHFANDRPFKYEDIDIPYRKAKNQANLHIVISTCERFAFMVTRNAMDKALVQRGGKPKKKETIYEPNGADYFSTPVSDGIFVYRGEDQRWHKWAQQCMTC